MNRHHDDQQNVTAEDFMRELKTLREGQDYHGNSNSDKLDHISGLLGRIEERLEALNNKATGRGEWSMILAILLGFILWRVW